MPTRRTTINIDVDLLRDAMEGLGTTQVTETIHRALDEAVKLQRRRWLIDHDLPDLTPAMLERIREPRTFAAEPRSRAKSA